MLKGILHIHSTYSDGDFTLSELRRQFLSDGCRFACVTDHADWFDAARLAAYREECARLSDAAFSFVPGLEYGCTGRMHILGYGVTSLIDSCDPQTVIDEIRRRGGIAVVAHPRDEAFEQIERFNPPPDGIEVWNSKYDGRYAPRPHTFALLQRMRKRSPDLRAFYGQDLHWRKQYRGLFTRVACDTPDPARVLEALRHGAYSGEKGLLVLPADGRLAGDVLDGFARAQLRSQRMRTWIRAAKRWSDGVGLAVPGAIKAQVRRIF